MRWARRAQALDDTAGDPADGNVILAAAKEKGTAASEVRWDMAPCIIGHVDVAIAESGCQSARSACGFVLTHTHSAADACCVAPGMSVRRRNSSRWLPLCGSSSSAPDLCTLHRMIWRTGTEDQGTMQASNLAPQGQCLTLSGDESLCKPTSSSRGICFVSRLSGPLPHLEVSSIAVTFPYTCNSSLSYQSLTPFATAPGLLHSHRRIDKVISACACSRTLFAAAPLSSRARRVAGTLVKGVCTYVSFSSMSMPVPSASHNVAQ